MNYQTISEIYEANAKIREKLKALVAKIGDEQAEILPEGEKWTIKEFVEHIAIVDEGMMRICAKLLNAAKESGIPSDGTAKFTEEIARKMAGARAAKFEAPDRVRPTGTKTIAESLARMDATQAAFDELKPLFESVECSEVKFPHPALGDMTAHEWLALRGGHEARHIKQIEGVLEKIN